jgi:hypothetical protein
VTADFGDLEAAVELGEDVLEWGAEYFDDGDEQDDCEGGASQELSGGGGEVSPARWLGERPRDGELGGEHVYDLDYRHR